MGGDAAKRLHRLRSGLRAARFHGSGRDAGVALHGLGDHLRTLATDRTVSSLLPKVEDLCEDVLDALETFKGDVNVQEAGLALICTLLGEVGATAGCHALAGSALSRRCWLVVRVLATHVTHVSIQSLGLRAIALLCTSVEIQQALLHQSLDVFSVVVTAMKKHLMSEEIQLYGCQVLHILLRQVPEEELAQFVETKEHRVLASAAWRFPAQPEVVSHALAALHTLASVEDNCEAFMSGSERCYNLAVSAMMSLPGSAAVQERGCALLLLLSSCGFGDILVLNGAHGAILQALRSCPESGAIQASGLACLARLADALVKLSVRDGEAERGRDGAEEESVRWSVLVDDAVCWHWLEEAHAALETHGGDAGVQESACVALAQLLSLQPKLQLSVGDGPGLIPVHRAVVMAVLLHPHSPAVLCAATDALLSMASACTAQVKCALLEKQTLTALLQAMEEQGSCARMQRGACLLLALLLAGREVPLDVMTLAVSAMALAMRRHAGEGEVQLAAMNAVISLLSPGEEEKAAGYPPSPVQDEPLSGEMHLAIVRNQCLVEGLPRLALKAMNKFISELALQEAGLRVLECLAAGEGAPDLLLQQGATDSTLHSMQTYPLERDVQLAGLNILGFLTPLRVWGSTTLSVLAEVITVAMQAFGEYEDIQLQGCSLALALLKSSPQAPKLFLKVSFHNILFPIMKSLILRNKQCQFLAVCSQCMVCMTRRQGVRDSMLRAASEAGDAELAEFLLLLDADPNESTGHDSLLCKACAQQDVALTELLLKHGACEADVHAALRQSLVHGNADIVGLLLHRLGSDPANKAVSLGRLRLASLHAAWLRPLFTQSKRHAGRTGLGVGSRVAGFVLHWLEEAGSPAVGSSVPASLWEMDLGESALWDGALLGNSFGKDDTDGTKLAFKLWGDVSGGACDASVESPSPTASQKTQEGAHDVVHSVDLSGNELSGDISGVLLTQWLMPHLSKLLRLDLQQNRLTAISPALATALKSLTSLNLSDNGFQEFPRAVLLIESLAHLGLSHNCLASPLRFDSPVRCSHLRTLNLSHNGIAAFPEGLPSSFGNLDELLLEGNKIKSIPTGLNLPHLRHLDVSRNDLEGLPGDLATTLPALETLLISHNRLGLVGNLPSKLSTVKLSDNELDCVPSAILNLQQLRVVDLGSNCITVVPRPSLWRTGMLKELLLGNNLVEAVELTGASGTWARLEKLHLGHNRMTEVPKGIGQLESLTSLDLSYNDITTLPNELGGLHRLWDLQLDALKLDLDLTQFGKTKDLLRFLYHRLRKAVPYNRMKLMVMGSAGRGKSTLLRRLQREKLLVSTATLGVDVRDWAVLHRQRKYILNCWDFAGQEEFYSTHPCFMSQRALYVLVYDASRGPDEVASLRPWLMNIKVRAPLCPVILVGTHEDKIATEEKETLMRSSVRCIEELCTEIQLTNIADHKVVCCLEESGNIKSLRESIVQAVRDFKIKGQPVMGQLIPHSYGQLEERLCVERGRLAAGFPVISRSRLQDLVADSQIPLDSEELPHATRFLHEAGVLLHYDDPALQLTDLYFLDPQWLCSLMAQVVTVREVNPFGSTGLLRRADVEAFLLRRSGFPQEYVGHYIRLLERFQIALPLGDHGDTLLVPSSLPEGRPALELPGEPGELVLTRWYCMPYFPMGFWARLITRILAFSSYMLSAPGSFLQPSRKYWRQGLSLHWGPDAYCLLEAANLKYCPTDSSLKITVPNSKRGWLLLGRAVDHVDSLIEEWFPGLLEPHDGAESSAALLHQWAGLGPADDTQPPCVRLAALQDIAESDDVVFFPRVGERHSSGPEEEREQETRIPIAQLAPDVVLADVPDHLQLELSSFTLEQSAEHLLGEGGFGSVYRALYGGDQVAVKIFNKHISQTHPHRLMRQELAVLSRSRHPSLVSLLAVGLRPRLLVMELAPRGSLAGVMEREGELHRTLKHRIALHVAHGLRFLHASMIIYRDLKPDNVLLFTLQPNAAVIAKIADYGIARHCCTMGMVSPDGTPGYRAPEVVKGGVMYDQQADVYAFGLLLYDLLTGGRRIVEGQRYPHEFDELASSGKLPDPVTYYGCSPWPDVQELIAACLQPEPQQRPAASQLVSRLASPELLSLVAVVAAPVRRTPPDLVVVGQLDGPNVWLSGGDQPRDGSSGEAESDLQINGQAGEEEDPLQPSDEKTAGVELCCLDLTGKVLHREVLPDQRVLSLCSAEVNKRQWVLAGTRSGRVWAVSAAPERGRHSLHCLAEPVTALLFVAAYQNASAVLAGTANGTLAVFVVNSLETPGCVVNTVHGVGSPGRPVTCLTVAPSAPLDRTVWGACGTQLFALNNNLQVAKVIETTPMGSRRGAVPGSSVACMAVGKQVFTATEGTSRLQVWDMTTDWGHGAIDCAPLLREQYGRDRQAAHVQSLLVQRNTALWVGTSGGVLLLLDALSRQPLLVTQRLHGPLRHLLPAQSSSDRYPKNLIFALGSNIAKKDDKAGPVCVLVWDANLPHHARNLQNHLAVRHDLEAKMLNGPFME
ncbi:leucine-rich repeat serine/threonine-protein kinase 2 isoform X1 [Lampetra planeri]